MEHEVTKVLDGVQLWKDGPYWATRNIGALNPEDPGFYFRWGDTVGYIPQGGSWDKNNETCTGVTWVSSTGERMTATPFDKDICPAFGKVRAGLEQIHYIGPRGDLVAERDAATAHWGKPWRMPTSEDFDELIRNCTTVRTTREGMPGVLVTGRRDYADKSIFLPAAGHGWSTKLFEYGFMGHYRSSSSHSEYCAVWCLRFCSETEGVDRDWDIGVEVGYTIRPLRDCAD